MRAEIEQYTQMPRDLTRERELGQQLRQFSERERLEIVQWAISQDVEIGLSLARKSLNRGKNFEAILWRGLSQAEGESIRPWLYCVLGPMSMSHFYQVLGAALKTEPQAVENVLRYLPEFLSPTGTACWTKYWTLLKQAHSKAIYRGAISEWLSSHPQLQEPTIPAA